MTFEAGSRLFSGYVACMSQPLSILHLFTTFDPAGADGWSRRAVRLMTAFGARARHRIVAADDGASAKGLPSGVDHEVMQNPPPLRGRPSVARYEAIARAMRGHDLVLSYGADGIDGVMARRAFARDTPPIVHHEDPRDDEAGGARLYRRLALPAAAGLVVTGAAQVEAAQRRWKARATAIADGVDLTAFAHGPDATTVAGFRRSPRDVVIGVVADLSGAIDLTMLVRAAAGLSARFRLVMVGAGAARADLERAALAMGIDERLVLPGALSPGALYLGGFDLLVLPPRLGAAPPVVVEAMAIGLPILALRGSGAAALLAAENREVLADHAGEVHLRDAMQRLVADPALRASIGVANRAQAAAMHDEVRMIAASATLYATAAGRQGFLN